MTRIVEHTDTRSNLSQAIRDMRCVHALTGDAPGAKMCANGFDCSRCPFDQMLDDTRDEKARTIH